MNKVLIFGAGGHAKVVMDIVEKGNLYEIAFLVDDNPTLKGKNIFGYRVLGGKADLRAQIDRTTVHNALVAIGNNPVRTQIAQWLWKNGFQLITAIHPSAQVARGVSVGPNTVVMAAAVINADTVLGHSVIINTAASVDHDCVIGDATHVAPGCHLCGSVTVGAHTLIGAGTTVIRGITIGENAVIGAGSVVVQDIPANVSARGNPARPVKSNESNG